MRKCTCVDKSLAHNVSEVFGDFVDQGLQTGGIDIDILDFFLLLRMVDVSDQFFADITNQALGNLTDYLGKALDGVTYGNYDRFSLVIYP
jgi:hypothetical protein